MLNLLQGTIDSYLIVAQTISNLQKLNVTVEQAHLVSQLHVAILQLHSDGVLKYASSCLVDVLNTAFGRFAEMNICQALTFDTQAGSKIVFVKGNPKDNESRLE